MKYISVQPDINYFHWQVELYIFNFLRVGIRGEDINVIFLNDGVVSEKALSLQRKYEMVNFFFYKDTRLDKRYIPSIKPWGMYLHFKEHPELEKERFFYHDSDIIFREKIDESLFTGTQQYMSDTISYIGYDYCVSKGKRQLEKMADVVGIAIEEIKKNQLSSGGAQYVLSSISSDFWLKVYNDSNALYWLMDRESQAQTIVNGGYPIQKWCAEMWATLWNLWYFNFSTEVHKELDFCFATAPIEDWYKHKILHNAGVTEKERSYMFFKGDSINRVPYHDNFDYIDLKYCSSQYVANIEELAKTL